MEVQLEEQSQETLLANKQALENLVKSPGWALLVDFFDEKISLESGGNAGECREIIDILKKEHRGGRITAYAEIAGAPELLVDACEAELKQRRDAAGDDEGVEYEHESE